MLLAFSTIIEITSSLRLHSSYSNDEIQEFHQRK